MQEDVIEPLSTWHFMAAIGMSGLCIGLGIYYIVSIAVENGYRPSIAYNQFFKVEPISE